MNELRSLSHLLTDDDHRPFKTHTAIRQPASLSYVHLTGKHIQNSHSQDNHLSRSSGSKIIHLANQGLVLLISDTCFPFPSLLPSILGMWRPSLPFPPQRSPLAPSHTAWAARSHRAKELFLLVWKLMPCGDLSPSLPSSSPKYGPSNDSRHG